MSLTIALAQTDVSFASPKDNFEKVATFTKQATTKKADVVVFPEMWNTGYALPQLNEIADVDGEQTKQLLSQLAADNHINIVGGSVATKKNGKFFNTNYVYDANGQLVSEYDKVHLFGLMNEGEFITAGDQENHYELAGVPSAGIICYDLRFPEWIRTNTQYGAKVLYIVAEWPDVRIPQWEALVKARAIENQAFVVAVNRVGADPDNQFNGHSLVVDPLGNVVAQGSKQEELFTASLDLDTITAIRGQIPVFKDRRVELYH